MAFKQGPWSFTERRPVSWLTIATIGIVAFVVVVLATATATSNSYTTVDASGEPVALDEAAPGAAEANSSDETAVGGGGAARVETDPDSDPFEIDVDEPRTSGAAGTVSTTTTVPTIEIAPGDIAFEMNPRESLRNRTDGHIIAAGEIFTPHEPNGRQGTPMSDTAIHMGAMVDGQTLRYGRVADPVDPSREVIEYATQWVDNSGYHYQPGMHNSTVRSPNDPLFFDGTRVQTNYQDPEHTFGLGDTIWQTFSMRIDADVIAANDQKIFNQWHAPDVIGTLSPMLSWQARSGQCLVAVLYWQTDRPNQDNRLSEIYEYDCTTGWEDWVVRVEFHNDNRGQLEIWRRTESEDWYQLVDRHDQPFGANYSGLGRGDVNQDNYITHSYYSWHFHNTFDTSRPVRRMWWAWSALIHDDGHRYSFHDVAAYLDRNL